MEGTLVKIRADVVTEGALVITCFPSVGMVSSVVGHYLIDNLELEFVGGVVDPRLPPLTLVTDGKPMPIIRAYAGKPRVQYRRMRQNHLAHERTCDSKPTCSRHCMGIVRLVKGVENTHGYFD